MATTRNTRLFLGLTGGVLALGVAVGLAVSYGRPGRPGQSVVLTSDLQYLPADARIVAAVDLRAVRRSPMHRVLASHHRAGQHPDSPFMRLGLNLELEVEALLMATVTMAGAGQRPDTLVLVRGPIDVGRLQAHLTGQSGQMSDYKGIRVVRFSGAGDEALMVALLSPTLLAVGRSDTVTLSIDRADGLNLTSNETLMRSIRGVAGGDVWAVGRADASSTESRLSSLPAGTVFAATVRVEHGIEGSIRTEAQDQKGADNIRDLMQGMVALARLQTARHPELEAAVNSLQLTTRGTVVTASFDVPVGALEAVMPKPPGLPSPPGPATP